MIVTFQYGTWPGRNVVIFLVRRRYVDNAGPVGPRRLNKSSACREEAGFGDTLPGQYSRRSGQHGCKGKGGTNCLGLPDLLYDDEPERLAVSPG